MASNFNNNNVMTHVEHCEATLKSLENEEANTQFETSLFSCDDPYTPVVDNISKRSKSDGALNNNNGSQFLKKMDELRRSQSMFDTLGHNSNKKMERGDFDDSMSESSNDAWYEKEIVMHHRTMSPDTTPEPLSSPSIGVRMNKSNKSNHNVKVNNHFRMKNQWNLNNTYDINDEEMSDSSMNEDDMVMNVHGRSKSDGLLLRPSGLLAGEFSENDAAIKKVGKIDGNESDSAVSVSSADSSDSSVLASDYLSSGSEGRKGRMARSRAGLYSSSRAIAAAAAPYQHEEQHHQQASRKEQEKECKDNGKDDANNNKEERWFTKGESILENIALLQKLVGFLSFLVVFMFFMQANMMNQMNQFGAKQDEILNFMGKRGFGCQYDFNDVFSSNNFIELLPIASVSGSASATVTTSTHIQTSKNKRETRTEKVTRIELVGEDNGEDSKNDWGLITEYVSNVMKITSLTFPITIPTFETQNKKAQSNADDKENAQNEDSSKNDTLAYSSLFAELSPYMIIAPNVLKTVLASKEEETRTVEEAATRSEIEERSENTSSNVSDESDNFSNYYLKNDGNSNNGEESILSFDDMGLYNNSYHEMNNKDTIVLVDEASNYFEESNDDGGDNGEGDDDAYHGDNDDFESFYESDDNEEDDDRMEDDNEDERENDGERKEMARYRNEQVSTLAVLQDEKNKHEKRKQQLAHLAHEKEMKMIRRATATQSRNDEKIQDNSQNVGQKVSNIQENVFSSMNKNQMIQNADAAVVEQMSFVSFEQSEENDKDKQEWQSFDENQNSNNSENQFLFERDSQKQETMKQQNDNENSGQQENQENNQNKNDNQQNHGGSSSGYGKADSSMTQSKNLQNAIDNLDSKIEGRILLLSLNANTMVFAKRNDENETQDSIKIIDAAPQGSETGGEQSVTQTVIQLNNRFANLSRNCNLTFRNDIGLAKQFGDRFESMYTKLNQNDKMQMQFAGSPDLLEPIKPQLQLPRLLQLPQLPQQLAQLAQGNAVAKAQDKHQQQLEQQQQQQERARVLGQKQSTIENVSQLQSKMQELIETIQDQNNKMQNEIQSISGELFCHDENVKQLSCDCEEDLDCMNGILDNIVNESGFSYSSQLVKSLELLKMNVAPWELLKQIGSDNDNKIDNFMNQDHQIYQSSMFRNDYYNDNNNKRQHRMRFQRYVKFGKFGNDDESNKNSNANWNSIFENLKSLIKRCLNFEFQDMVAWTLGIYSVIPQRWSKCSSL